MLGSRQPLPILPHSAASTAGTINEVSVKRLHIDKDSVIRFRGGVLTCRLYPRDHEKVRIELADVVYIAYASEIEVLAILDYW